MWRKLTWLVVVLGVAGCGDAGSDQPDTSAEASGEALYTQYCALCHGDDGEGYLGAAAVAIGNDAFLRTASDAFLIAATLEGRPGTRMAPYGTQAQGPLGQVDAEDIVAYMRTWQVGAPIDTDFTVSGDAVAGQAIFARDCASCHGTGGVGDSACSLNNPVFLRTASDGFLRVAIESGRPGTPMAAYGEQLSSDEIDDVVAYVRSLQ